MWWRTEEDTTGRQELWQNQAGDSWDNHPHHQTQTEEHQGWGDTLGRHRRSLGDRRSRGVTGLILYVTFTWLGGSRGRGTGSVQGDGGQTVQGDGVGPG